MTINFRNIDYLREGNPRQQLVFEEIKRKRIFENLKDFQPVLAGTIPLGIDLEGSDLDILCRCKEHETFIDVLRNQFASYSHFHVKTKRIKDLKTSIAQFETENFKFEIFGQDTIPFQQHAYRHMLVEYEILKQKGPAFRKNIIKLKSQGMKTEPAFAKLLNLSGDPYEALLKLEC